MIDLNEAAKTSFEVLERREANGAVNISTESWRMLEHMASEVMETAGAFHSYLSHLDDKDDEKTFESMLANELADVIICCLAFAGRQSIDIEFALKDKMQLNELRANKQGDKL